MERIKSKFDDLANEAIDNIRADRAQTKELLKDLVKYISSSEDRQPRKKILAFAPALVI